MTATWLKILHIAALSVWCAGLLVLPGVLVRTGRAVQTGEWEGAAAQQLRSFGRACYLAVASPAAVLAIGSGMALIFQRGAFAPWLFAKLALVGVLVLVHMQHGRSIARLAQAEGRIGRLLPALLLAAAGTAMVAILWLVLAKPGFDETLFPDWLRQPRPDRTDWDWTGQSSLASSRPI
ncbi:putative membrane protein [Stella humosa]|uniref:Protoporphyrinogen IX oxidase n=1 Tax=Stella humosa TaxID=94 RepID=A0A3N1L7K0_9PROT|nr:CopD family protein [Stella humosa]ROP90593.1 putative membrane protein [Stella humosa]BBK29511.1 hypothetical protein STHU_01450 [Stella humosa]